MQYLLSDSAFYWLLWLIFSLVGFLVGWTLRASWRERAVVQAFDRSEQERNSLAHLYAQLRQQHDAKAGELKKIGTEVVHLRQQVAGFDLEKTVLLNTIDTNKIQVDRSQMEARLLADKVLLLEDQALHLRTRNSQLTAEFNHLQEEIQGWKNLQRDFSVLLRQVNTLEGTIKTLEQERIELQYQLQMAQSEMQALRNRLAPDANSATAAADFHLTAMPSHRHELPDGDDGEERKTGSIIRKLPVRK
jgi:chromosome segregation ATPase